MNWRNDDAIEIAKKIEALTKEKGASEHSNSHFVSCTGHYKHKYNGVTVERHSSDCTETVTIRHEYDIDRSGLVYSFYENEWDEKDRSNKCEFDTDGLMNALIAVES